MHTTAANAQPVSEQRERCAESDSPVYIADLDALSSAHSTDILTVPPVKCTVIPFSLLYT